MNFKDYLVKEGVMDTGVANITAGASKAKDSFKKAREKAKERKKAKDDKKRRN